MRDAFRRRYGAGPLHLLASIGLLLIAAAAVAGWFDSFPGPTVVKILAWFVGAIIAHDVVALPLYSALDRIASGALRGAPERGSAPAQPSALVYLRVPVLLSGLIFLVFFPEILGLGDSSFFAASGFHQHVYLARYLITAGVIFVVSAFAYAWSVASVRRRDRAS